MNAIVMNTINLAVSEYDWSFQSITPTHAGSATGLFELGGNLDGQALIQPSIATPLSLAGESLKQFVQMVYFTLTGEGDATMTVRTKDESYDYDFTLSDAGLSRCQPGKGIRENYMAYGFSKPDGAAFTLDRIEVLDTQSKTRRV